MLGLSTAARGEVEPQVLEHLTELKLSRYILQILYKYLVRSNISGVC